MKTLATLFFLVLGTSSFSQHITVSSVVYDSLETYFGNDWYSASVTMSSNTLYSAEVFFIWSADREEISSGGGQRVAPYVTVTTGTQTRNDVYTLYPWNYQEYAQCCSGIYFQIRYDVVDGDGNVVQSYASPVRTWRFPTEISTAVSDQDASPSVSIYPNPTQDRFQIEGYSGSVHVTDAIGRVVLSTWLGQGETADVSALPSGTYIILADGAFLGRLQKL